MQKLSSRQRSVLKPLAASADSIMEHLPVSVFMEVLGFLFPKCWLLSEYGTMLELVKRIAARMVEKERYRHQAMVMARQVLWLLHANKTIYWLPARSCVGRLQVIPHNLQDFFLDELQGQIKQWHKIPKYMLWAIRVYWNSLPPTQARKAALTMYVLVSESHYMTLDWPCNQWTQDDALAIENKMWDDAGLPLKASPLELEPDLGHGFI